MKTLKTISVLLVVASTLLSSCSLLDASSYESPRWKNRAYNGFFNVPAEGGIFEFKCANDQFYISKISDSSMSLLYRLEPVDDLTYDGPFYTITCNNDNHNWTIKVDPFMATSDESNLREVKVSMWDESDDYYFVFQFKQSSYEDVDYIH